MNESRILIQYAHPKPHQSKVNKAMMERVKDISSVRINELYALYPDYYINVPHEQKLLKESEILILHFPMYHFSSPGIIKEWMDVVLEYGFAFGKKGKALHGKQFMIAISIGGRAVAFRKGGFNNFTVEEFLRSFERTAYVCGMNYWPPFVIHGTHRLTDEQIQAHAQAYKDFLISVIHNNGKDPRND